MVAAQPFGVDPGTALPPRQGAGDALRDSQPRPGMQPISVLCGPTRGGARWNRERLRAVGADPEDAWRAHVHALRRDQASGVGGLSLAAVAVGARALPADPLTDRALGAPVI